MEPYLGCDLDFIDNLFINNISENKKSKKNNINLIEDRQNFGFNYNKPQDNNNLLIGLSTKTNVNKKNNKGQINQIKIDEIYQIKNENKENKEKKLLGRKKREDLGSGEHNKFSGDNLIRKVKYLVLDNAFKFINEKIKKIYNGNIGHGIYVKKLFIINQKQISEASIQFNKDFLNKTLGEIFSEDISSRYTTYNPRHNHFLIKALINEKDEDKKNYFKKLFNITFVDCLKHFRGTQKIEELKGMKGFNDIKSKYEDDTDYLICLEHIIMNHEEVINNKRARKLN